ncbi:MAG: DUF4351 domain-containing protein, partial [Magnetococcales bacterium]|nr:DUF4351 domain-containing protein [Magnetococcales bacterium]
QEGRQEGRQEEAVAMLKRQLQRRFAAVPDWANEKITRAELSALENWSLRILDAHSLDDVFSD